MTIPKVAQAATPVATIRLSSAACRRRRRGRASVIVLVLLFVLLFVFVLVLVRVVIVVEVIARVVERRRGLDGARGRAG
jgi:predicted PurR-regulated permease PerM